MVGLSPTALWVMTPAAEDTILSAANEQNVNYLFKIVADFVFKSFSRRCDGSDLCVCQTLFGKQTLDIHVSSC